MLLSQQEGDLDLPSRCWAAFMLQLAAGVGVRNWGVPVACGFCLSRAAMMGEIVTAAAETSGLFCSRPWQRSHEHSHSPCQ